MTIRFSIVDEEGNVHGMFEVEDEKHADLVSVGDMRKIKVIVESEQNDDNRIWWRIWQRNRNY